MSFDLPLEQMSVADKLATMEALWASLCSKPAIVDSPAWHQEVLADRTKRLESGEAAVHDWSEAKKRLQDLGQ
ncbi:MAG: addiction module protein [Planctomycetes bacterium]|nr:addiction module protein [Planctomycetota bacterium]